MRRTAPSIPVPRNMFRHFAVITILITACIALFADGERRDAIGAEIDAQKQKTEMANAEAGSLGPNKTRRKVAYYSAAGGGGDYGAAAGEPMVNPEGNNQNVLEGGNQRGARAEDYGVASYNRSAPSGPPGLAEMRQGLTRGVRIGSARKGGGGASSGTRGGPTDAQRNAIDAEGFRRAGPPTPPKS